MDPRPFESGPRASSNLFSVSLISVSGLASGPCDLEGRPRFREAGGKGRCVGVASNGRGIPLDGRLFDV